MIWITAMGFIAFLDEAAGSSLGPPQFQSDWLPLKAQTSLSDRHVLHGLGVVPTLVEVLVKSQDEPNKGFIFKAVGNADRDDDSTDPYGAVIYLYNDVMVRVMVPQGLNQNRIGAAIYTGKSPYWRGANFQQSFSVVIKVRCWTVASLPTPCFDTSGILMVAGSTSVSETFRDIVHGLGQYPDLVRVRAYMNNGLDAGWYTDAQVTKKPVPYITRKLQTVTTESGKLHGGYVNFGSTMISKYTMAIYHSTGGLKFAYNNETIRVWTSSYPHPGNVMFARTDGWGSERIYYGPATSGYVEVLAWCGLSTTVNYMQPIGPNLSSDQFEIFVPDLWEDDRDHVMSVLVEATEGPNNGYRFEAIGGAMTSTQDLGQPCAYGGLSFAYNSISVRVWLPADPTGAAICIPYTMGHGTNSQASQSGQLIIHQFPIIHPGEAKEYEPDRLVCSQFTLIGNNSGYMASPIDVHYNVSTSRACNVACQEHIECVTYAFSQNTCKIYDDTNQSLLYPELNSQVWGLQARSVLIDDSVSTPCY